MSQYSIPIDKHTNISSEDGKNWEFNIKDRMLTGKSTKDPQSKCDWNSTYPISDGGNLHYPNCYSTDIVDGTLQNVFSVSKTLNYDGYKKVIEKTICPLPDAQTYVPLILNDYKNAYDHEKNPSSAHLTQITYLKNVNDICSTNGWK